MHGGVIDKKKKEIFYGCPIFEGVEDEARTKKETGALPDECTGRAFHHCLLLLAVLRLNHSSQGGCGVCERHL